MISVLPKPPPFPCLCPNSQPQNDQSILQTTIWGSELSPTGPHPQQRNAPGVIYVIKHFFMHLFISFERSLHIFSCRFIVDGQPTMAYIITQRRTLAQYDHDPNMNRPNEWACIMEGRLTHSLPYRHSSFLVPLL